MKKIFAVLLAVSAVVCAEVRLPKIFGSNMVLQQKSIIKIWGYADPGEKVKVKIADRFSECNANNNGKWIAEISELKAGGPYDLIVEGKNKIVFSNVMIGEVWLCSGQSNMEFQLKKCSNADEEISKADYPFIRIFNVKHKVADFPQEDVEGEWQLCKPDKIGEFSGAAFFFGIKIFNELNVPVGLVQSTWGGTPAEAWTSKQILESDKDFVPILTRWNKQMEDYPSKLEEFNKDGKALIESWKIDSINAVGKGMAPPRKPAKPEGPGTRNQPSGLFNGMIYPLAPFSFRGVIWYQGEANASRAYQYRTLFPAMIVNWRNLWGRENFPFYYVQLPNLLREPEPSKSGWAELRESQLKTLSLNNTGMAVTIDIGDSTNLHPANKKDVGLRLALLALNNDYGKTGVVCSGPIFKSFRIAKNKIVITFNHTADGLNSKDGKKLRGFKICGEDKIFVNAEAKIIDNEVIVWSDHILNPVAVRYAWADNPQCGLYNSAMLPASPFRTDDWPVVTFDKR